MPQSLSRPFTVKTRLSRKRRFVQKYYSITVLSLGLRHGVPIHKMPYLRKHAKRNITFFVSCLRFIKQRFGLNMVFISVVPQVVLRTRDENQVFVKIRFILQYFHNLSFSKIKSN